MNKLAPAGENAWELPRHARIVVYDERERGLLTIYDCAAAQKPPTAQLLGRLNRVSADCEREATPTGERVTLREPAVLERTGEDCWNVERGSGANG
ncbi:hypothetical protein [Halostella sp. PRR32]|uniref:hypothetical protein n=1 Tax=Halostella sp. PRR32 TaxID=3098147 RepID=UPI002B1D2F65|nr:hypothetical protein [Halostella sp. PRR32]